MKTPGGKPASLILYPSLIIVKGVISEGLWTIQFPAAKAGPNFHSHINNGKFHGEIRPTTPYGSLLV